MYLGAIDKLPVLTRKSVKSVTCACRSHVGPLIARHRGGNDDAERIRRARDRQRVRRRGCGVPPCAGWPIRRYSRAWSPLRQRTVVSARLGRSNEWLAV